MPRDSIRARFDTAPAEQLMTTGEAAKAMGVSISLVRYYSDKGVLKTQRTLDGQIITTAGDVRMLEARRRNDERK